MDSDDIAAAKKRLRLQAQRNRSDLTVDHRRLCAGIRRFLATRTGAWVVSFDPMPGEPDLRSLFDDVPARRLAITRTPVHGRDLTVHDGRGPRERHRFGYEQPVIGAPAILDSEIDVVLVPGLAFDRHGGRLGFGAGYYDRFLARLAPSVARVGVSDGFIVDHIPVDTFDIPMTHLATEIGVVPLPL